MSNYDIVGELQSYLVEGKPIPVYKIKSYMLWVETEWIIHRAKQEAIWDINQITQSD